MNSLPDNILRDSLSLLPQVDVFRLIRVSLRFQRFLRPQLETLALGEMELALQFRQRRLGSLNFQTVGGLILESYGELLLKFELVINFWNGRTKELDDWVLKVAGNCHNLVEVILKQEEPLFNWTYNIPFPGCSLAKLQHLKVLTGASAHTTVNKIDITIDRMLEMQEISAVCLDASMLAAVRRRDVPISAVKGLVLHTIMAGADFKFFPCLELIELYLNYSNLNFSLIPSSLKKLTIITMDNSLARLSAEDLEPLKRLVGLLKFCFLDNGEVFTSFDFLSCFTKLEHLCMCRVDAFDAEAFTLIPAAAPLTCIQLIKINNVTKALMDCLIKRTGLEKIELCGLSSIDVAELLFNKVLAVNCASLREVTFRIRCITDTFLEQLTQESILRLKFLDLKLTGVTASGIGGLMRRRHQLIQTAKQSQDLNDGIAVPRSLMRIWVDQALAEELSGEGQLACDAMVWLD